MLGKITIQTETMSIEQVAKKEKYLYQILDQGCQMFEINKIKSITGEYLFTSGFSQYFGTQFRNKNNVLGMCKLCTLAAETAVLLDIQISGVIVLDEVQVVLNGVFTKAGHVDCFGLGIQKIINDMKTLSTGIFVDQRIFDANTMITQAIKHQLFNNYYVDESDKYYKLTPKLLLIKNIEEQFTEVFNISSYQDKQSYTTENHQTSFDNISINRISNEISDNSNHCFETDDQNIHKLIEKSIIQIKLQQSWVTKIYKMFLTGFKISDQFQTKNNDQIYQKYALLQITWKSLLFKPVLCIIVFVTDIQLEQYNTAVSQCIGHHFNSKDTQLILQLVLSCSILISTILSLIFYISNQQSFSHQRVNQQTNIHYFMFKFAQVLQLFEILLQYFQFFQICLDYTQKQYVQKSKVILQEIITLKYVQVQIQTYLHISPFYNFLHTLSASIQFALLLLCGQIFIVIVFPRMLIYIFGLILSNFNLIFQQIQHFEKVLTEINSRYMLESKFQTHCKNIELFFDDISLAALRQQETYLIAENNFNMELFDVDYSWCDLMLKEKKMELKLMTQTTNITYKIQQIFSPKVSRNFSLAGLNKDSALKLQIAILKEFNRVDNRYVNVKNLCRLGNCVVVLFKAKNIEELTKIHDVDIARYFDKLQQAMCPYLKNDIEMHLVRVTYDTASVLVLPNRYKKNIYVQLKKGLDIALILAQVITSTENQIDLGVGIGVSDVCQMQLGTYLYNFEFFGSAFQEAEKAALNCQNKFVCFSKNMFEFYTPNYSKNIFENLEMQMNAEWVMLSHKALK
ncbi:Hypothetical_protein [Hexamita inflata]|uniref:Hypothetical_protein n=1 Tax=Hexamita inflata TaxID=28002 RepID=A0AA86TQT0_9EUKA|nr:Hypothetical protein HINF_LOCUS7383 [Hexamita inflata]